MRFAPVALLLLLLAGRPAAAQEGCPAGRLGLVLAGGGAKGFAHIGVLRALDSLGIRPDIVVGTSIGSIMGALYASGLSGREIDSLTRTLPLGESAVSPLNRAPHAWGDLLPAVLWEQDTVGFTLVSGSGWELRTNAVLNRLLLRANLAARGNFDSLPIPFRAVATDLRTREAVVLRDGDLAQAVRASIAIPLVFTPERIGDRLFLDGGISSNVPVAAARGAGATRLIVVDLRDDPSEHEDLDTSPASVAGRLAAFLFRQPLDSLGPDDVYIWPDVRGFGNLDFRLPRRAQLVRNGRQAADSLLPAARCFVATGPARVASTPIHLRGWEVVNGTGRAGETMGRILALSRGQRLRPEALAERLMDLPNIEAFRELWLGPVGRGDTISFQARVVPAARRVAGLGVAYDHDLGGRLWVGGLDRTTLRGAEASSILTLGRFESDLSGTLLTHLGAGRTTVTPLLSFRLQSERVRQFVGNTGDFESVNAREASGTVAMEWGRSGVWRARAGLVATTWRTPDDQDRASGGTQLSLRTDTETRFRANLHLLLLGDYQLGSVEVGAQLGSGRLLVEPLLRAGLGRRLPVQTELDFGGSSGFPGLQVGERRGDRELLGQVQGAWQLRGPVALRLLVAAGRSTTGGNLFGSDRWLAGARIGAGALTPIGPVQFEYGFASNGRRAAFIRVGRWF